LIERDGSRYAYRLTSKGSRVALLFMFFHKPISADTLFRIETGSLPTHAPLERQRGAATVARGGDELIF
jgi:hypothetical protein